MSKRFYYNILCVLLFSIAAISVKAQVGEQRHNLAVGINGGINLASMQFSPTVRQKTMQGINIGGSVRYISEKYFQMICGVLLEVNFSQHGWSESYEDYPTLSYTRKMNYIDVPFLAHIAFGKERGMQFFLHAGPQLNFLLSESSTVGGDWVNETKGSFVNTVQHNMPALHTFDYGITGGAGTELRTKVGNFSLEGRYYFALSDIFDDTKRGYFGRSAHQIISVKLSYLFDLKK